MTEEKASYERGKLIEARRKGEGPRTLTEKRVIETHKQALLRAEGLTLSEFWEKDYIHNLKSRIKESSWEKEVEHYNNQIKPLMGDKPLKTITNIDVARMIDV